MIQGHVVLLLCAVLLVAARPGLAQEKTVLT